MRPANQQRKIYRPITAKDRDTMKRLCAETRAKLLQGKLKV